MRFLHPAHDEQLELSLNDVFIVPDRFEGRSRLEVSLAPLDFPIGAHPVVSANMNAVTGKRMAETMARYGGLGVLPQDMDERTVERIVAHIKAADPRYDTAIAVEPDATLRDVMGLIRKRAHDLVVVIDAERRPLGIVTHADLRDKDQYTPVHRVMSRRPVILPEGVTNQDAFLTLDGQRVKAAPVVDAAGRLRGVMTRDDAVRMELLRPSIAASGRLAVAVALGISGTATAERAERMLALGVDALVLDTAHGHQRRMLDAVAAVREVVSLAARAGGARVPIVAGNVCTAEGTADLFDAGADIVKVNVGPGAMCTTRMQTGCGRPTFSSVLACARVARERKRQVWADGGVKHPRDVALYLAAGASRVMVGSMLAGTFESPGDVREDREGRLYKENYGMASARAVGDRAADLDAFERAKKSFFREGISTSRVFVRAGYESVGAILVDMITGVQSAFTYVGAMDANAFHERVVVGVQTPSGFYEGKPVDQFGLDD